MDPFAMERFATPQYVGAGLLHAEAAETWRWDSVSLQSPIHNTAASQTQIYEPAAMPAIHSLNIPPSTATSWWSNVRSSSNLGFEQQSPRRSPAAEHRASKHVCKTCKKSFVSAAVLRHHENARHGGDTSRLRCALCGHVFSLPSGLRRHQLVHDGVHPLTCDACGQRFRDLSTYTKHKRTHTGERPYQCDVCSKNFTQSGNLLRHKRNVHKAVPSDL